MFDDALSLGSIGPEFLKDKFKVFPNAQAPENRRFLRQVSDSQLRPFVDGKTGDIPVLDADAPGIGRHEADDHIERRRLSGSLRAEKADNLPHMDVDVDHGDNGAALVRLAEFFPGQDAVGQGAEDPFNGKTIWGFPAASILPDARKYTRDSARSVRSP